MRTRSSRDDDPALLLTAGHCVPSFDEQAERPAPGTALIDRPVTDGDVPILDEHGYLLTSTSADRLVYATMTGTDIAVYRLDESYAQLAARGVKILRVTDASPHASDPVSLVLAADGTMTCHVEAIVPTLREGPWEQQDAIRLAAESGCETYPGTSGAAVVASRWRHDRRGELQLEPGRRAVQGGQPVRGRCRWNDPHPPQPPVRGAGHRHRRLLPRWIAARPDPRRMHPHRRPRRPRPDLDDRSPGTARRCARSTAGRRPHRPHRRSRRSPSKPRSPTRDDQAHGRLASSRGGRRLPGSCEVARAALPGGIA